MASPLRSGSSSSWKSVTVSPANQGILSRCERWRLYSVAEDSFGQPLKFVLFHVPNAKLMEVAAWVF